MQTEIPSVQVPVRLQTKLLQRRDRLSGQTCPRHQKGNTTRPNLGGKNCENVEEQSKRGRVQEEAERGQEFGGEEQIERPAVPHLLQGLHQQEILKTVILNEAAQVHSDKRHVLFSSLPDSLVNVMICCYCDKYVLSFINKFKFLTMCYLLF